MNCQINFPIVTGISQANGSFQSTVRTGRWDEDEAFRGVRFARNGGILCPNWFLSSSSVSQEFHVRVFLWGPRVENENFPNYK